MSFAKQSLQADLAYSEWATGRLLDAATLLTPEERTRDLGLSHRSVLGTLSHVYESEQFWIGCLLTHTLPPMYEVGNSDTEPEHMFEELQQLWPGVWLSARQWLATVPEEELAHAIPCRITPEAERPFPRWELIRHSVNHATQHRGQVVAMLRMLGKQPPNVDIMGFYLSQ